MHKPYLIWHGVSTEDLNVILGRFPNLNRPSRKYSKVSVAGRNGDLFFMQDAWNNYEQKYQMLEGTGEVGNAPENTLKIMEWLYPVEEAPTIDDYINLEVNGYHQLIDSYEPDTIRLACFVNDIDIKSEWNRFGKVDLLFNCRPERFTADAFIRITKTVSGEEIINPSIRPAKPFLKIYGSGDGTLIINDNVLTIENMVDYLHIDCESQNCFRLLVENRNNLITLDPNGFPVLKEGRNTISWTGGITQVDIYPRWWNL